MQALLHPGSRTSFLTAPHAGAIGVPTRTRRAQLPWSITCAHRAPSRANGRVARAGRNQWYRGAPGRVAAARRRTGLPAAGSRVQRACGALARFPTRARTGECPCARWLPAAAGDSCAALQDAAPRSWWDSRLILALPEVPPSAYRSRPASRPPCSRSRPAALEVSGGNAALLSPARTIWGVPAPTLPRASPVPSLVLLARAWAHGDGGPGIALGRSVGLPRLAVAWDHRWRSRGRRLPTRE